MKLAEILKLHPNAEIEVQVEADFYVGSIDYEVPRDTLAIAESQWPDAQNTGRDNILIVDAVIRDYVNPDTLRDLDLDDNSDDEWSFNCCGFYNADIEGKTAPLPKYGEQLPITIHVYAVLPDTRDPDPDTLNAWCSHIINREPASTLANDARAWLDGTAADNGPEMERLVADWRINN